MQAIPLHRVTIVRPFTQFLADFGAPVEHGLRQAKLPVQALDNMNAYVSSQRFWAFAGNMARREGIEDLGFRVGQRFGANCADPDFSTILSRSPTLYHALKETCKLVNATTSRSRMWLSRPPPYGGLKFFHRTSFGTDSPFIDQMDWFALMAIVGIVQLFAGPRWQPMQIGLTSCHAPIRAICEQLPDTRLLTSQQHSYIVVESALLSLPALNHSASLAPSTSQPISLSYETPSPDFAGSLKQALQAYLLDGYLTIDVAAEISATSKRTLQRKLAEAGLSYSELLDQVRFDAARAMLQDHDAKVMDVAHTLGYSDSSHFARAFRRLAGVSPQEYRRQSQHFM